MARMARREARDDFPEFVQDQLAGLGGVACRRMFGGHGLYRGPTFFGILYKGRLYFKTDESSRTEYLAHGMQPFRPNAKQTLKNYYEVPPEVVEDGETLAAWARRALAAKASPTRKPVARRRSNTR